MRRAPGRSAWSLGIAAACFAAVAIALVSQHVFDMQPCAWCVLQRLIFVVIGLLALLTFVWHTPLGRRVGGALMALFAAAGIAAALWQHFVAAASGSCNQTLADRIISGIGLDGWLPEIFAARASCADAAVNLWAVPYAFWSLALFALIAAAATRIVLRPPG
ncbi:MAG: disulfide bond formation protein B [Rubrivivax sp.]